MDLEDVAIGVKDDDEGLRSRGGAGEQLNGAMYADQGYDERREPKTRLLDASGSGGLGGGDDDDDGDGDDGLGASALEDGEGGGGGGGGDDDLGSSSEPKWTQDYNPVLAGLRGQYGYGGMTSSIPSPCCYKRRVGNLYIYCEKQNPSSAEFNVQCMVGPCWPMMLFTFGLIFGISGFVYSFTFPKIGGGLMFVGICSLATLATALQRTACVDPGMVARYDKPVDDSWRWNELAQVRACVRARMLAGGGGVLCGGSMSGEVGLAVCLCVRARMSE